MTVHLIIIGVNVHTHNTMLSQLNCMCGCTVGEDCSQWPLLTTYNSTDNMFTCSGNITYFVMCNKGNSKIRIGLSLWRRDGMQNTSLWYISRVQNSEVTSQTQTQRYALEYPVRFHRGNKLMVLVFYHGSTMSSIRYVHKQPHDVQVELYIQRLIE